ncbi:MAG TPA: glycosyltransferase [Gemmatimonadaceae bacterium]|nr:glycosyltransferase [Gemmatimonadaceae bacterium]
MMLPSLSELGWHAVVMAVDPRYVEAPLEDDLLLTIPEGTEIVRCRAVPQELTRRFGFGSLGIRAGASLRKNGDALIEASHFDLVFFSTTEFGVIPLGSRWKRRYGVPFVVDLQDPWVNNHYRITGTPPPGGMVKHRATQMIAAAAEGRTLRAAAHVISVSPKYRDDLCERYPFLSPAGFSIIPFGGSLRDFDLMQRITRSQRIFDPSDGRRHWLYAGTAPPGIRSTIIPFFLALKRALDAGIIEEDSLRIHFVGTDYAPAGAAVRRIIPTAQEFGFGDIVSEHPQRIPYLETLKCLTEAHALLLFGWDDPGYTASKLYPYILAKKPLLTVLHAESSGNEVMHAAKAGVSVCFDVASHAAETADGIFELWFRDRAFDALPSTDWAGFAPYTAEAMSRKVARVFDSVCP